MCFIIQIVTLSKRTGPSISLVGRCNGLVLDVKVDVLVDIVVLQLRAVPAHLQQLVDAGLIKVCLDMTLVLGQNLGLGLLTTEAVTKRSLNRDLLKHSAVVQSDSQGIGDGTLGRVVVVGGKLGVLNTADALAEVLKQGGSSSLRAVRVVGGSQAAENEHSGNHVLDGGLAEAQLLEFRCTYLHTVVAISEVIHLLELLVNDADACLVCTVGDLLNVLGALAHGSKLGVDLLSGLNGSLGMELGYRNSSAWLVFQEPWVYLPG